jgi:TonB family protein
MKKASIIFLLLLIGSSILLAQPAKVLLLEPETKKIQYSEACDVYLWMREAFSLKKYNFELMDPKQVKKDLRAKKLYLNKCKNPNDYYLIGDSLKAEKLIYTKLVSADYQYIFSATVYDIKNKAVIYQKETAKNITCKSDVYDLVTSATKVMADNIFKEYFTKHENDTTRIKDNTIPKGEFFKMEKTPELIKRVAPVYPLEAKDNDIQGKVILYLLIDIDGRVRQVDIAKSSGSALLDDAAKEVALQFVFTPAIAPGNKPVRVWVMYPVNFTLE